MLRNRIVNRHPKYPKQDVLLGLMDLSNEHADASEELEWPSLVRELENGVYAEEIQAARKENLRDSRINFIPLKAFQPLGATVN